MNNTVRKQVPIRYRTMGMLLIALGFVTAPHVQRIPIWITAIAIALSAWSYYAVFTHHGPAHKFVRFVITMSATLGVFAQYGTIVGRDAGVALLINMTFLKLLELNARRDLSAIIFMGYFLIITQFLYGQQLYTLPYLIIGTLLLTTVMATIHHPVHNNEPLKHIKLSAKLLLQAAPVCLVLFVLFPRVQGPIWGLSQDATKGMTGLSETMSPGAISSLSLSDSVAFRVKFGDQPPPRDSLYWRGPVLWNYSGKTWTQWRDEDRFVPVVDKLGGEFRYVITLEPHNKKWIFALDLPDSVPQIARITPDYQLESDKPILEMVQYEVSSKLFYKFEPDLSYLDRRRSTALPDRVHPKTRALGQQWRDEFVSDEKIVEAALSYFRNEPFAYTLNPPLLSYDSVDDFLFNTRKGFCEHYASAFVVLMRAANVPARVVTGYQGGEMNPHSDYMIVRQSDAHAWAEVWIAGRGWTRIDPTSAVSPARVELGLGAAVPNSEFLPQLARTDLSLLKNVRLMWDAVNNTWTQWVISYGPNLQKNLMSKIGIETWQKLAAALATGFLLALALVGAFMFRRKPLNEDEQIQKLYANFCKKLARIKIQRQTSETPKQFAKRASAARPDIRGNIEDIVKLYINLRYEEERRPQGIDALKRLVENFHPTHNEPSST